MEYVPEELRKTWKTAFSAIKSLKNTQVKRVISEFHTTLGLAKETGKLSIFKEMKKFLIVSVPIEKEQDNENGSIEIFRVGKTNCEISKEERHNAIVFLSSTGKLLKLNQIILQKIFNVSQSTIAKDISFLKSEGRICPDF